MDSPLYHYSKELSASIKIIQDTLAPSLKFAIGRNFVTTNMNQIVKSKSFSALKNINDTPATIFMTENNTNLDKIIPPYVIALQKGLELPSLNPTHLILNAIPKLDISTVSQAYKSTKIDFSKYDFRVGVASQELNKVFIEEPETTTEKLLFKDTSEPTNELDNQLFDILNQQRKILDYQTNILEKINSSEPKNINGKESNKGHGSPAFYKNKMWYAEQIGATLIGLIVNEIINRTIAIDPQNTLLLVLFLRRLLQFLK